MFGRAIMHDARPSLIIFAVLSAVLRSGFRHTRNRARKCDVIVGVALAAAHRQAEWLNILYDGRLFTIEVC